MRLLESFFLCYASLHETKSPEITLHLAHFPHPKPPP
jgi:hypothetical protein